MKIKRNLFTFCVFFFVLCSVKNAYSVLPVVDPMNLPQNIMTAISTYEQLATAMEQLKELKTDVEHTVKNTLAPAFWIWDKASDFNTNMQDLKGKFDSFVEDGVDKYLSEYHGVDFYAKCFKTGGCLAKQLEKLKEYKRERLEAMRKSSIDIAKGIAKYLETTKTKLKEIELLELNTKNADGHMKAIQFNNQWLSMQTKLLVDLNTNSQALQNHIRVIMDETYVRSAMEEASVDNIDSKTLSTKIRSLPSRFDFLRLR